MSAIEEGLTEISSQKTEHGETLEHLSSDSNFQKKTVLFSPRQAYAFATLSSIAEENDITFLKRWLKNNADWLLSVSGKGRNDIVEVSKFKESQQMSYYDRLINGLGGKK